MRDKRVEGDKGDQVDGEGVRTSKLNLVDLAGSEKSVARATGTAQASAAIHREGCFINKSLTFLEQVENGTL